MEPSKVLPDGLGLPDRKNQYQLIKSVILAALAIASFGFAWQLVAEGFGSGQSLLFWIYPSFAAALGITFLAFFSVVNRNKVLLWSALSLIFFWYVLVMPKDPFVVIGGAMFVLLALLFDSRVKHDENARADFSMSRVMRDSMTFMVYALLLIIGFNVYAKISVEFNDNPKQFYDQIGHYAAKGLEYVPSGLGDFNPDQRFDDFVAKQAQLQDPVFSQVPDAQKGQILTEVKNQLLAQFHIQVSGNPFLGDVVAGAVSEKIQSAAQSYQNFFPVIFAVIVVALLRTLAFLFIWLVMLVSWIIFRLLLLFKFFRIEKVQVEVKKLQI